MAESILVKQLKILLVVLCYWVVSISLVFVNKYVLSNDMYDSPIFITLIQCVISSLCIMVIGIIFGRRYNIIVISRDIHIYLQLLVLTNYFVAMIIFNNFTLKLITISYYNIVRALSTVFNLIFTRIILKRSISLKAFLACLVIIVGYFMGLADTKSDVPSFLSLLIGIAASMFVSLFAIYTQSSLEIVDNNLWLLQNIININSVFIISPLIFFTGESTVIVNFAAQIFRSYNFFMIVLSGLLGFVIGYFTNLQIKYTSALTHNISGTAKSCFQTIIAVIYYQEVHSFIWWLGSFFVLFGSAAYSYVRNQEMIHSHHNSPIITPSPKQMPPLNNYNPISTS